MNKFVAAIASATLFAALLTLGGRPVAAAGTTHWVNDDQSLVAAPGQSCNQPGYRQVQDAVTAAAPGDHIVVCEGVYTEQITVNKSLDVTGNGNAIIKAPPSMTSPKAIVRITGASTNTSISHLTISGPGGGPCDSIEYGIRVDGGANASITNDHITEIHDTPFSGCQNGVAILVGRQSEGTTGTAVISHNVIDNYQKNGPTVDNAGSHATIDHNTITGIGPTLVTAQNGIQISRGAVADVEQNSVSGNSYIGADGSCPAPCSEAVGILPFVAGAGATIEHNTLSANDNGVDVETTSGLSLQHNGIQNSVADGVFFDSDTSGNTIGDNDISVSGSPPASYDAQDLSTGAGTAGTANTWNHNHCSTSDPSGLCDNGGGPGHGTQQGNGAQHGHPHPH